MSPTGWPDGGVHRMPGDPGPLVAELARRGWRVGVVPPVRTDAEVWAGLERALDLPDWFGRNLDALDEVVHDLDVPTALVLASWSTYARLRPERWERLLQVLRERAGHPDPPFVVLLAD